MKLNLVIKSAKTEQLAACLFLLPSLCGFLIFFLIPFVGSFYYSVVDTSVSGNFVGLKNYKELFENEVFMRACKNTAIFMIISIPFNVIFSLFLAITVEKAYYSKNLFRMFFVSPMVIPVASTAMFWQIMFDYNGLLNNILNLFSIHQIDWMNTNLARVVVVIIYLWKNIGYNMILYLAGLYSIPASYYEVASIDGASSWKKFRSITLVYISPTMFFVFIISIMNSFKTFREVYMISGDYPHESIYMFQHYTNNMFSSLNYQKLTSSAYVITAFIVLLVVILYGFQKRSNLY